MADARLHGTLDAWIAGEAIPFAVDSPSAVNAGLAKVVGSLGDGVALLSFGEALHGGQDILLLRNRLFQRLVEAHCCSAIAIESSFPRVRVVSEYPGIRRGPRARPGQGAGLGSEQPPSAREGSMATGPQPPHLAARGGAPR